MTATSQQKLFVFHRKTDELKIQECKDKLLSWAFNMAPQQLNQHGILRSKGALLQCEIPIYWINISRHQSLTEVVPYLIFGHCGTV